MNDKQKHRVDEPRVDRQGKLYTLHQEFHFPGRTARQMTDLLRTAPLLGDKSVFGRHGHTSVTEDQSSRIIRNFLPLPLPLLRFDVIISPHTQAENVFVTTFEQPHENRPYLVGDFVWMFKDDDRGCQFIEEINTTVAKRYSDQVLDGKPKSIRRMLFFKVGHIKLMESVASNLANLSQ